MRILVHHGGQQIGPFSIDELRARLAAGQLSATDLAWIEGTPSWVTLDSLLATPPAFGATAAFAPYVVPAPKTDLAVTSLVLGILSFTGFCLLTGIPAIICGHMARARARRAPAQYGGEGMALGGLIMGYVTTVLPLLIVPLAFLVPLLDLKTSAKKGIEASVQIGLLSAALDAYERDVGRYPSTREGLDALVHQPVNQPAWQGPYTQRILPDPWGHPYIYAFPQKKDPKTFDLISTGPDGRLGTSDDINGPDEGILGPELEESAEEKGK